MITASKPDTKKQKRSLLVPLMIAAAAIVLVGVILLVVNRVHASDPTLTAAPPVAHPGPIIQASPEKMARQQQIQAKMNAEVAGLKASSH